MCRALHGCYIGLLFFVSICPSLAVYTMYTQWAWVKIVYFLPLLTLPSTRYLLSTARSNKPTRKKDKPSTECKYRIRRNQHNNANHDADDVDNGASDNITRICRNACEKMQNTTAFVFMAATWLRALAFSLARYPYFIIWAFFPLWFRRFVW